MLQCEIPPMSYAPLQDIEHVCLKNSQSQEQFDFTAFEQLWKLSGLGGIWCSLKLSWGNLARLKKVGICFFFKLGIIFHIKLDWTQPLRAQTNIYFIFHQTVCHAWMYLEDKLQRICEDLRQLSKIEFFWVVWDTLHLWWKCIFHANHNQKL